MTDFSSHTPGTFSWPELATTDQKAGVAFYRSLFGWDLNEQPIGPTETYSMFTMRGKEVAGGGMMAMPPGMPPHVPSYWMPYFQVADCDASAAHAARLGAKTMMGPQDIPSTGRFAILSDPQGAVFALYKAARA